MTDDELSSTDRGRLLRLLGAARRARVMRQWLSSPEQHRLRWVRPVLVVLVFVVVVVLGVAQFNRSTPSVEAVPTLPAAQVLTSSPTPPPPSAPQRIVVSVVGKVRHVGVVRLNSESRVADAISLAGGAQPGVDLASVNLARKLTDGEQIYVGVPDPSAGMASAHPSSASAGLGASDSATGAATTAKVNVNSADAEELDALPGVGEVTAKRIVEWRTAHQRFTTVQDLQQVDGIGPSKFAKLRDQVTVG